MFWAWVGEDTSTNAVPCARLNLTSVLPASFTLVIDPVGFCSVIWVLFALKLKFRLVPLSTPMLINDESSLPVRWPGALNWRPHSPFRVNGQVPDAVMKVRRLKLRVAPESQNAHCPGGGHLHRNHAQAVQS